jgi:hypothetical protein
MGTLPLIAVWGTLHCTAADAAAPPDMGMATDLGLSSDAERPRAPPRTFLLTLENGAFPSTPDHPSALVYLPTGFDPTPPVAVVVYIHGLDNCVENIVRPENQGQACTTGGSVRTAFNLIGQMEAAGKNAILLCPEVAYDQRSVDPGKLGTPNGFLALLTETLQKLPTPLSNLDPSGIGTVALASHSGGYATAAAIATQGGVPISELYLLDSLYGDASDFQSFVQDDTSELQGPLPHRRFASVYTDTGGTLTNNQSLASLLAGILPDPSVIVDDRTTATWPLSTYHHGVLFKRSALSHDGVALYYFQMLLSTSSISPIQ